MQEYDPDSELDADYYNDLWWEAQRERDEYLDERPLEDEDIPVEYQDELPLVNRAAAPAPGAAGAGAVYWPGREDRSVVQGGQPPRECQIAHHGCSDKAVWWVTTHTRDEFAICHELWISMHLSFGDPYVTAVYTRIKEH